MKSKWLAGLLGIIALFTSLSMVSVPSTANEVVGAAQSRPLDNTDRLIVKFRDPATQAGAIKPALASTIGTIAGVELTHLRALAGGAHVFKMPQSVGLEEARAVARRLSTAPDIAYAEPDQLMHVMLIPNDTQYLDQWHYKEFTTEIAGLNLPPAWDITTGSAATVVAVIDTGLRPHADIDTNILDGVGRVVPGFDFITADGGPCPGGACMANDGDGRDADPSDPGDWITATENASGFFAGCGVRNSSWHGTHVAGTIGALSNNGVGVAGVNWATKILPVRVLGKCGGFVSDIADGMRWAVGLTVSGAPINANPAKVLNLSLGGSGACSATFQSAINAVVTAGSVVVVAGGNSNIDAINAQPANCNNVIAVAALNRSGGKAYYSNFGTVLDIAAPGGAQSFANDPNGVLSTLNTGTTTPAADSYVYYQGTSMAAPHVAGVASLMFGVNPSLTFSQVTTFLQSSARAFPTGTGSDCTTSLCGAGIVNAAAAVQAATPTGPTVTLSASPTTVAVGGASTLTWSSTNATSCTASGGWLGTRPISGSESTGALTTTTTFSLSCTGAGGSASQSVTVAVTPTPTVTLSANPTTVVAGGSSTLTWSSTNATSCTASGAWTGAKPISGSESTGALTTTSTFTLSCTGVSGSASQSATVTVTPATPPPTVSLSANPTTVVAGNASTLTWSSTNATSCTASGGWSGAKPVSGSESTGALTTTTTFTLSCTGAGGSASQSATVTVTPATPAPTVSLSANPTTVASGSASTLTWSSTNATSCSASGGWSGAKPISGSESTGALAATTTFTLSCTGAGGSASQSATVTVSSATNKPPVAKAGPDQKVKAEKTVTLNGSASFDPDGTIVSYAWKQIAGKTVTLSNPNGIITSFKAPTTKRPLDLVFTLTVTDDKGASDVDRVKIRVVPAKDDH